MPPQPVNSCVTPCRCLCSLCSWLLLHIPCRSTEHAIPDMKNVQLDGPLSVPVTISLPCACAVHRHSMMGARLQSLKKRRISGGSSSSHEGSSLRSARKRQDQGNRDQVCMAQCRIIKDRAAQGFARVPAC